MGFLKFLFQIAFWLFMIVVGFIGLGLLLDHAENNPVIGIPVALVAFVLIAGIALWKPIAILYAIYRTKEELKK